MGLPGPAPRKPQTACSRYGGTCGVAMATAHSQVRRVCALHGDPQSPCPGWFWGSMWVGRSSKGAPGRPSPSPSLQEKAFACFCKLLLPLCMSGFPESLHPRLRQLALALPPLGRALQLLHAAFLPLPPPRQTLHICPSLLIPWLSARPGLQDCQRPEPLSVTLARLPHPLHPFVLQVTLLPLNLSGNH